MKRSVEVLVLLSVACRLVHSRIRYSVSEELEEGSIVANLARDIGLDTGSLVNRDLRIALGPGKQYIEVNKENGNLYINERIDREELCGYKTECFLYLEVIIENPLKIYSVEIEITDTNDNAPKFPRSTIQLEISELVLPGERFSLDKAVDPDVGTNSVSTYILSENGHFDIEVKSWKDGSLFANLILTKALDREEQAVHDFILTAVDGGVPAHSGSASIIVRVLDANDNAPQFDHEIYTVNITENIDKGALVVDLNAVDLDEGTNADIVYSFSRLMSKSTQEKFALNSANGEVRVTKEIDYEEAKSYELYVEAKDRGPISLVGHCKIVIQVSDTNDNSPEIIITSFKSPVLESIPVGTVIALFSVTDSDSGENGKVDCSISEIKDFELQQSLENYYALVTRKLLDRETTPEYNITVSVRDRGSPPLSRNKVINLELLDVNDNPPAFQETFYAISVMENNVQGELLRSIVAVDPDLNENKQVTYSMLENTQLNNSVSQYFSVNPENGNIYALKTLDYEKEKEFLFHVEAKDSGVPQLRSNVTVHIIILDQNDNSPEIVSPWRAHGSVAEELIPRSTDKGFLVTKVIAIDADSMQNSRITYQFLQISDSSLFSLDQFNGEIRTARMFSQRDSRKQRLVVLAKDNGEPALSSTVTIKLSTVDPALKALSSETEELVEYDIFSDLNVYLIIGLGAVSFLFLITLLIIILVKCQRPKPVEEPPPCRNSFPSLRNSMNSQIADSTLISSDAYWYSLFLAETRKGKVVVRQTVPNGAGYFVSSIPRSTGLTETSDSAASTLQESSSGFP
ncbi:protocadherin alpha-C2-like isoform X8 [Lepisosteus oculatus]|uniref:protocadherin alpha-C2-like isoform X8 n=1 Tax=Lepisosteus oculatus TaxID=7918 RepID=UPI0035F52911